MKLRAKKGRARERERKQGKETKLGQGKWGQRVLGLISGSGWQSALSLVVIVVCVYVCIIDDLIERRGVHRFIHKVT